MTGDFWWGFWMWFITMGVPTLFLPIAMISAIQVEGQGRYSRAHFRWFRYSCYFNLVSWVVMGCLWIATTVHWEAAYTTFQETLSQQYATAFAEEVNAYRQRSQVAEGRIVSAEERILAAEKIFTNWLNQMRRQVDWGSPYVR